MGIILDSAVARGKSCTLESVAYSNVRCTVFLEQVEGNPSKVQLKSTSTITAQNNSSTAIDLQNFSGGFTWVSGLDLGFTSKGCPTSLTTVRVAGNFTRTVTYTQVLTTIDVTDTLQSFVFNLTMVGPCGAQSYVQNRTFNIPPQSLIDCQYNTNTLSNSVVIGRSSTTSDVGSVVSAIPLVFENDIFLDLLPTDVALEEAINSIDPYWYGIIV